VLVHGFSDDGLCWTPVADALAPGYDVIMLDTRGHGRSDGPDQGYGMDQFVADLAGVIAAIGLEHPAVLGHSLGALTALAFAGTYREVPRAILLEDPPPWWVAPPDGSQAQLLRANVVAEKRLTREELIARSRRQDPQWSDAELGPWADSKLRLSFNVLNWGDMSAVDWPAVLGRVTCPALLITGDAQRGAAVTPENAASLQALVPHMRVAHIVDAGHSIRRDQFVCYMQVVHEFLAEVLA
jgi:pimeloyl-ACP methyl ester carboxylesterase